MPLCFLPSESSITRERFDLLGNPMGSVLTQNESVLKRWRKYTPRESYGFARLRVGSHPSAFLSVSAVSSKKLYLPLARFYRSTFSMLSKPLITSC